jgi:hypothetical protein
MANQKKAAGVKQEVHKPVEHMQGQMNVRERVVGQKFQQIKSQDRAEQIKSGLRRFGKGLPEKEPDLVFESVYIFHYHFLLFCQHKLYNKILNISSANF